MEQTQPKRKAGRRPIPPEERHQKLMVTLPPHQIDYLRGKKNTSFFISQLVEDAISKEVKPSSGHDSGGNMYPLTGFPFQVGYKKHLRKTN